MVRQTAAAAGNAHGPADKEQQHQQNHQTGGQNGVHGEPAVQGQVHRGAQGRPQGPEGAGLGLRLLRRGILRLRLADLGQSSGKGRHPHHMDRIVPGSAVLGSAGDGQQVVALLQGRIGLGDAQGLAVLGGGGKGYLGGLIGDVHGVFRDFRGKGRGQLPRGGGQLRQGRVAAERDVGVRLPGDGDGVSPGGPVGCGNRQHHRVDANGQLVAADGYIGPAVGGPVIQGQPGHVIGYGDAVFRGSGGEGRRQGIVPAGQARQIGVAGGGRGHAGRPGRVVQGLVAVAVGGHDVGDGGADPGPGGHAGLHLEGDGQHSGAAGDGIGQGLVIGQQVAAAHIHRPAGAHQLAGAGKGQGAAVVVQHGGDALDVGAADGEGYGDAVTGPDAAGAGEAGPGGLRRYRSQAPQQQRRQQARQDG